MKLVKVFSEVRYETSFLFDDPRVRNDIYKELRSEFQLADHEDKKVIIFINLKSKTNLLIYHDRVIIDMDEPSDIGKIKSMGGSYIPYIMKRMELATTSRIGLRAQYIYESNNSEKKYSEQVMGSLFNPSLVDFIKSHNNIVDVSPKIGYSINVNHELAMNVGIGLNNFTSGQAAVNSNSNGLRIINIDNQTPILDLDIYTHVEKETSQINGLLKACCDNIENYSNKIWSLVK